MHSSYDLYCLIYNNFDQNVKKSLFRITPLPFDGPQGMYMSGNKDGTRPGTFYVNTHRPTSQ